MRKHTLSAISLCLAGLATTPAVLAQTIGADSPPGAPTAQALPARGQTMDQVERQQGAPTQRFAAVGQPPITRWAYPSMIVYFEYDHVVHTVALRP
jgi:hypothetical protein